MTIEPKAASKPKRWGSKRRYSILLSSELAERFERVAKLRNGAKSALVVELLIALWHLVRDGVVPQGVVLRPAH
jgi:hypothetical protein